MPDTAASDVPSDVLVVGGGPSGLALAAELAARDLRVRLVAPHPPRPFAPTYGAWLDDLPGWARQVTDQVWTDVRVYTPGLRALGRPYALLDNAALLSALLARAGGGLSWTQGQVRGVQQESAGQDSLGYWRIHGAAGEIWRARLVVDAAGHGGLVQGELVNGELADRGAGVQFPGGAALQTAYGLVARFRRPPVTPGSMVWMDYRPVPGLPRDPATFLYAMHLGADRYLVEETSLIARPGLTRADLRARLCARLDALNALPTHTEAEEWVAFPMNAQAPAAGPVLAFGAAAGRVQPISGFQVAGALADAPGVAEAVAQALHGGSDPAQAGWQALWSPERRAARQLHLLGVGGLLRLPAPALPRFMDTFFGLSPRQWSAFLSPDPDPDHLTGLMLTLFARAPGAVRRALVQAALDRPGESARALASALHSALESGLNSGPGSARRGASLKT